MKPAPSAQARRQRAVDQLAGEPEQPEQRQREAGVERLEAEDVPYLPGEQRAEDQEGSLRDVDHVEHTEDQRDSRGEEGVDPS
jgi:hypothetical protein